MTSLLPAEYLCKIGGAQHMAYPPIAASGPDCCTIHYSRNDKVCVLWIGHIPSLVLNCFLSFVYRQDHDNRLWLWATCPYFCVCLSCRLAGNWAAFLRPTSILQKEIFICQTRARMLSGSAMCCILDCDGENLDEDFRAAPFPKAQ